MAQPMTTGFMGPASEQGMPVMHAPQGAVETERQNIYLEAWRDLSDRGWQAASVINLHPFQLYPTGVLYKELKIQGVPRVRDAWDAAPKLTLSNGVKLPYFKHVFNMPDITIAPRVQGSELSPEVNSGIHTTLPRHFAADILQQNNTPYTRGGVFAYEGDHEPFSNPKTVDVEMDRCEKAHANAITYYNQLLQEANNFHASGNSILIRELGKSKYHRWAVTYLRLLGQLAKNPVWFNDEAKSGPAVSKHCGCGAEVPSAAVVCKECNHILEPYLAYKEGRFDETSPGGVLALRRCTRAELEELGLYPEIKPQAEHQKDRAKEKKAKGN